MFKNIHKLGILTIVTLAVFCRTSPDPLKEFRQKERKMEILANRAAEFIAAHGISKASHEFVNNPAWQPGNLFIFLIGPEGRCYAFGGAKELIWYDFNAHIDISRQPLLQELTKRENGNISFGYDTHDFRNKTVYARFKKISQDKNDYILGCGFYIENSLETAIALTRKAADIIEDNGFKQAFEIINNPLGKMKIGDIYLFVADNNDIIIAHGRDRARIGHYLFDDDPAAAYFKKLSEDITQFITGNQKSYLTSLSQTSVDQVYMEKHIDPRSKKSYLIGAVFHQTVDEKRITTLVKETVAFLKSTQAEGTFNEITTNQTRFKIGGSFVAVYNFDGLCLADNEYPLYVGTNRTHFVDESGQSPLKIILKNLQTSQSTLIPAFTGNALKLIYAERVNLPEISLVVTSGFWPSSQETTVKYMTEMAAQLIEKEDFSSTINHIAKGRADYLQGLTYPIIYDERGTIIFKGPYNKDVIWENPQNTNSTQAKFIEKTIARGNTGGGWMHGRSTRGITRNYVKKVEKKIASGETSKLFITACYYI